MDGGEHTGERMGALQGICIDNFVNGVGVGLGGFRRWQRIFHTPHLDRFRRTWRMYNI